MDDAYAKRDKETKEGIESMIDYDDFIHTTPDGRIMQVEVFVTCENE